MAKDKDLFFDTINNLIDFVEALPSSYESIEITEENWNNFKENYDKLKIYIYEGTDKAAKAISE